MCRLRMYLFSVLGVLVTPGVYRAVAVEVYTTREMQVVNGTDVQLRCGFRSSQPLSEKTLSIAWSFRPYGQTAEEGFFYYLEQPFISESGRFAGHVMWTGDVLKNDASITLRDVQFSFNGTFSCKVHNPPDVHGLASEIVLQVVQSVRLSEIGILAVAVGGAILLVLLILIVFITVRYCRHRRSITDVVQQDTEWKQSSAWEEDGTLKIPEKVLDTDSLSEEETEVKITLKKLDDETEDDGD